VACLLFRHPPCEENGAAATVTYIEAHSLKAVPQKQEEEAR